jgi:hypothetical protein
MVTALLSTGSGGDSHRSSTMTVSETNGGFSGVALGMRDVGGAVGATAGDIVSFPSRDVEEAPQPIDV